MYYAETLNLTDITTSSFRIHYRLLPDPDGATLPSNFELQWYIAPHYAINGNGWASPIDKTVWTLVTSITSPAVNYVDFSGLQPGFTYCVAVEKYENGVLIDTICSDTDGHITGQTYQSCGYASAAQPVTLPETLTEEIVVPVAGQTTWVEDWSNPSANGLRWRGPFGRWYWTQVNRYVQDADLGGYAMKGMTPLSKTHWDSTKRITIKFSLKINSTVGWAGPMVLYQGESNYFGVTLDPGNDNAHTHVSLYSGQGGSTGSTAVLTFTNGVAYSLRYEFYPGTLANSWTDAVQKLFVNRDDNYTIADCVRSAGACPANLPMCLYMACNGLTIGPIQVTGTQLAFIEPRYMEKSGFWGYREGGEYPGSPPPYEDINAMVYRMDGLTTKAKQIYESLPTDSEFGNIALLTAASQGLDGFIRANGDITRHQAPTEAGTIFGAGTFTCKTPKYRLPDVNHRWDKVWLAGGKYNDPNGTLTVKGYYSNDNTLIPDSELSGNSTGQLNRFCSDSIGSPEITDLRSATYTWPAMKMARFSVDISAVSRDSIYFVAVGTVSQDTYFQATSFKEVTPTASLIGAVDTGAPTITAFTIPSTSNSLSVAINALTAFDNTAVTGYLVKESSAAPLAAGVGWGSAPSSYTFGSAGSKTLYAWAKDAAGNVSAGVSASVTITLPSSTSTLKHINGAQAGTMKHPSGNNAGTLKKVH